MTERYPRIRFDWSVDNERSVCVRESLSICFYMQRPHQEVAPALMSALEIYRQAIGLNSLQWYPDSEGSWQPLDDEGWEHNKRRLLNPRGANLCLRETPGFVTGYEFRYHGLLLDEPPFREEPGRTCAVAFWLPTEYLEAHGSARARELALELGSKLPFNSGHAGLSFYFTEDLLGHSDLVRDVCFRHPGMDMPAMESLPMRLGTRVKGAYWLTFLGSPVLDALGSAAGLRSHLHSEGTRVESLGEGRAVVTLGEWPEAGDLQHRDTLPSYRELARVLEQWLYQAPRAPWSGFTNEDTRRWEHRLLD